MNDSKSVQVSKIEYMPEGSSGSNLRTGGGIFGAIQERYAKVDPASYLRRADETGFQYWGRRLGTLKPVELLTGEYQESKLKKALNAFQLVFVGIGAIIGTGPLFSLCFVSCMRCLCMLLL